MNSFHAPFLRLAMLVSLVTALLAASFGPAAVRAEDSSPLQPPAGNDQLATDSGPFDSVAAVQGPIHAMIELVDPPAAIAAARVRGRDAAQAGRDQKLKNERAQQALVQAIAKASPTARVIYRVQAAYNGIAVVADGPALARIAGLPGVQAIHRLALLAPTNANTQPLIGAPEAWTSYGKTGTGIKIGIIDTGIDYVHTMFGGPGTVAALNDARSTASNPQVAGPRAVPAGFTVQSGGTQLYPSAKVVGGFDFAGDAYNADSTSSSYNPTPRPDPNPEDCPSGLGGGHGSHVAGTAAGFGVNADGTTYTGQWDTTTPFDSMRIGPGVAPQAQLYALRVFGCLGSTSLTTQAIDWAADPNGDGDPSDHLDVINLSLGSAYGSPDDPSAAAMDNATQVGVLAAVSAGNSNDVFYVSGSPGSAAGALTVAASVDEIDVTDGFQIASPAAFAGLKVAGFSSSFNWPASAPLTAELVYNVGGNTTACAAFPAGSLSGKIVLVDWAPAGTSNFPCGSAVRANNAQAAGAAGIIMASGQPFFDTAIAGNTGIRAVFTTFTVGSQLKSALAAGTTTITFSYAFQGSGKFVVPGADDTVSTFSSRGPRNRDNLLKPDISAPGQSIFSTDAGTGTRGKSLNGTSMAAPHIAGVLALLRQANPSWSVAEIKALAMNTANHDLFVGLNRTGSRYGPGRVGAGRVDIPQALADQIVAYNAEIPRAVSVSFGAVEVQGSLQLDKAITVVNKGASAATLAVSYDALTTIPGVSYSFPDGSSVSVPAGGTASFRVRLSANAALMKNSRDATIATSQGGNPRQWLSEASGNVILTPASGPALRVPVYVAARPASEMGTAQSTISVPGATFGSALNLTGSGVSTGPVGPNEHNALVTPFELQGFSPALSAPPAGMSPSALNADLQYIGATASPSQVFFGLTTWRDFNTLASDLQFSIFIDRDRNGTDDLQLFATRLTDSDVFVTALSVLPATSGALQGFTNVFNANVPTAAMNNNVAVLPASIASLGMPSGSTRFNYRVESFSRFNGTVDRFPASGYLSFDFARRGVDFSGGSTAAPVYLDTPGNTVPLAYNQTNYLANNALGVLLLHHYNAKGSRAQVLPISGQITISAPASKTYGDAPFTVSATAATGQAVTFSTQTPTICSVSGTSVTILGAGACTVRATTTATANFGTASQDVTIPIARATLSYSASGTTQYSDPPASFTISFSGFKYSDTPAVVSGSPSCTTTATTASAPGSYPISCTNGSLSAANYDFSSTGGTLTITPEDARATYTGQQFVSTGSATATTANVSLVATIQDISAVGGSGDANPGDIRTATVTFVNRDAGNAVLCTASSIQLLNPADSRVGTASCTWPADLGSDSAKSFTVGILVGGNYGRNAAADDAVVTVSKLTPGSIAGGGYLINQASTGLRAGDPGARTNFGFNVKNVKSGANFQGNVNLIVISDGRTYQIKSTAITSLVTKPGTSTTPGTASFSGKATITDVTNPAAPTAVDGNASLQITMTDRGEPGTSDTLGITIWNKTSQLWFASSWNGTKTVEQTLGAGNLQVR